ncbi:hypothetical protein BSKO_13682 [Bryopsis sp. KO-2023]|nr:hypothetical protein BSKO_13682 [Bryopsis sp. KO-2023]
MPELPAGSGKSLRADFLLLFFLDFLDFFFLLPPPAPVRSTVIDPEPMYLKVRLAGFLHWQLVKSTGGAGVGVGTTGGAGVGMGTTGGTGVGMGTTGGTGVGMGTTGGSGVGVGTGTPTIHLLFTQEPPLQQGTKGWPLQPKPSPGRQTGRGGNTGTVGAGVGSTHLYWKHFPQQGAPKEEQGEPAGEQYVPKAPGRASSKTKAKALSAMFVKTFLAGVEQLASLLSARVGFVPVLGSSTASFTPVQTSTYGVHVFC